jgi:hypothetical protein
MVMVILDAIGVQPAEARSTMVVARPTGLLVRS